MKKEGAEHVNSWPEGEKVRSWKNRHKLFGEGGRGGTNYWGTHIIGRSGGTRIIGVQTQAEALGADTVSFATKKWGSHILLENQIAGSVCVKLVKDGAEDEHPVADHPRYWIFFRS